MSRNVIFTKEAPAPIGPYNQAISYNGLVYVSGQIALDPATGELRISSLEEETRLVLKNLGSVLAAAGSSYEQVIKCSIFLSDMSLFSQINQIYGEYFPEATAPARETVAVKGLPRGVNVEISCIAITG
jgi:2-iminobutanoate/2-iminopropanoate deaminase